MDTQHHILLVEDNADTRDSMALVLEYEGYKVVGAANGQEALNHLEGNPHACLILLDLMMPVLDGWEFRARQRQDPALAAIPVVVLSAYGSGDQKTAAMEAAGYLQKPVEIEDLLDVVKRYC
jgi:CheY-like chemotaxis protein